MLQPCELTAIVLVNASNKYIHINVLVYLDKYLMESLFSFGLYVEHINGLSKSCRIPSVGFRFLDYPTVVIQRNSSKKSEEVAEGDNNNIDNDDSSDDANGTLQFDKGKSCLFKYNIEKLGNLLNEIPLYVMVIDSADDTSRLMGCCSIPLISLFNKIKTQVNVLGVGSPTAAEEVDMYLMYNLMSVKTGELKLQLKLNFYGTSLLKHNDYGKNSSVETYLTLNNNELINNCSKPDKLVDPSDELQLECIPLKEVEDKGVQSTDKYHERLRHKRKREKKCDFEPFDDFHNTNVYCPPPLFLNLYEKSKDTSQKTQSSSPFLCNSNPYPNVKGSCCDFRSKHGSGDSISSVEEPYTEILQPIENRNRVRIIFDKSKNEVDENHLDNKKNIAEVESLHQHENISSHENHQSHGNLPAHLHSNINLPTNENQQRNIIDISKLPLLSALSAEIAKLTNFIDKMEVHEARPDVLDDNTTKRRQTKQIGNVSAMPDKIDVSNPSEKPVLGKPTAVNINKKNTGKVRKENDKPANKNAKIQKGKLKFKSTRTQKLRQKFLKQSKQVTRDIKVSDILQQSSDKDNYVNDGTLTINKLNVKKINDLNLNSLETFTAQIDGWMNGLHTQGKGLFQANSFLIGNLFLHYFPHCQCF